MSDNTLKRKLAAARVYADEAIHNLKLWTKVVALTAVMQIPSLSTQAKAKDKNENKTEINASKQQSSTKDAATMYIDQSSLLNQETEAPTRYGNIQADTALVGGMTAAYYSTSRNSVTIQPGFELSSMNSILHEFKHKDNANYRIYENNMSLEQLAKLVAHDEISAKMVEILAFRQQYIDASAAEREEILECGGGNGTEFYSKAVKEGKVNPLSQSKEDFDKEMKFIAQNTSKMWVKEFSSLYKDQIQGFTKSYLDTHDFAQIKPNTDNYNQARRNIYSIGGVDFSQYMTDISISNGELRMADAMIAKGSSREDVSNVVKNLRYVGLSDDNSLFAEKTFTPSQISKLLTIKRATSEISYILSKRDLVTSRISTIEQVKEKIHYPSITEWASLVIKNDATLKKDSLENFEKDFFKEQIASYEGFKKSSIQLNTIMNYIEIAGLENVREAIKMGEKENAATFENKVKEISTIRNCDFSQSISQNIDVNPNVKIIENSIKNGATLDQIQSLAIQLQYGEQIKQSTLSGEDRVKDQQKIKESEIYHGEDKFREHSEKDRVSPVIKSRMYDFSQTSTLLKQQRDKCIDTQVATNNAQTKVQHLINKLSGRDGLSANKAFNSSEASYLLPSQQQGITEENTSSTGKDFIQSLRNGRNDLMDGTQKNTAQNNKTSNQISVKDVLNNQGSQYS